MQTENNKNLTQMSAMTLKWISRTVFLLNISRLIRLVITISQTDTAKQQNTKYLGVCGLYHRYQNRLKQTEKSKMLCVSCHMFHVICHLSPVTNANSHSYRPSSLLTPPLCTVGWLVKT